MAVLQSLWLREDCFLPLSQWEMLKGLKGPVTWQEEVGKASRKRSGTADREMRLLVLELFKHMHGFLGNKNIFVLKDGELSD